MKSRRYTNLVRIGALLVCMAASPILRSQPTVISDTTLVCNLELDPPVMRWDEEEQRYIDTTFTATVTLTNTGGSPLSDVEVEIREAYDPSARVEFNPKFINENPVTFPVLFPSASKTATWHFRTLPNTAGAMQVVELGVSYGSNEVPRIYNACNAILQLEPEKTPYFVCSIEMPDTIRVNAYGTGLEPTPFDVVFEVENIGNGNGSIVDLACNFPDSGLLLSQLPANTRTRLGNWVIPAASNHSFTWTFDVAGRRTPRSVDIEVVAHANNGDTIICEKIVYIEPLQPAITCSMEPVERTLTYDPVKGTYANGEFLLVATISNVGAFDVQNLQLDLVIDDPDGYLEFDPAYSDNTNPKSWPVLFQGQSHEFLWGLRLAKPNVTDDEIMVHVCVNYGSNETPHVDGACCTQVHIEPVATTTLGDVPGPADFALGVNYPNPFSSYTEISYTMARDSHVSIAVYSVLGRELAVLVNERKHAGLHTVRFDARDLPRGLYIVRMNAAGFVATRVMFLRR